MITLRPNNVESVKIPICVIFEYYRIIYLLINYRKTAESREFLRNYIILGHLYVYMNIHTH